MLEKLQKSICFTFSKSFIVEFVQLRQNMGNQCTECKAVDIDEDIIKQSKINKTKDSKFWLQFQKGVQQVQFFDLNIPALMLDAIKQKSQQHSIIKPTQKIYKVSFPFYGYFIGKLINQHNPNGYGVIIITPQNRQQILKIYVGQIVNAVPYDKNGLCFYPNGSYFQGSITEFQANGQGKYVDHKASIQYIGSWVQSQFSGNGQLTTSLGKYTGKFVQGQKNGFGTYVWSNGNMYTGSFEKNLMNGNGKLIAQQCEYQGNFVNGYPHGQGIWRSKNQVYEGQFYMGMKQGKGKFIFENNSIYQGEFTTDKPDGSGVLTTQTQIIEGIWKNGINLIVINKTKRQQ